MKTHGILALLGAILTFSSAAHAQITIDGFLEEEYGPPVATDAILPTAGEGGAGAASHLDIQELYVTSGDVFGTPYLLAALVVAGNITSPDTGTYAILINSPEIVGTSSVDPFGRPITAEVNYGAHLFMEGNTSGNGQFRKWSGTAWEEAGSYTWNCNAGSASIIEIGIPLSALGNPADIQVAAFTAEAATSAQDTLPSANGNAPDFLTPTPITHFAQINLSGGSDVTDWMMLEE